MTEVIATLFEGHEIRVLEQDNDLWFPLVDLAAAWGINPNTLYQIITRNKKKFVKRVSDVHVTCTPSEDDPTYKSVNEPGLYVLLGVVNTDRLKNPEAVEAIDRFQYWIPELIQKYRKKELVPIQEPTINRELLQAGIYAEACGQDPGAFQAAVFKKHNLPEFAEVVKPALTRGESGWYNPSQLVPLCNDPQLNAERLNHYLQNNPKDSERRPYQFRDENRIWRLTPFGMQHGREYIYRGHGGHTEPRIEWRKSILYASGLLHEVDQ